MAGHPTPKPVLVALFDAFDSIDAICAELDDRQWAHMTECPGWSVKDVISHLIGIESMVIGRPATTHRATALAHVRNPLGEMNEHEVDARRDVSGSAVLAEWREVSSIRRALLVAADDDWFAAPTDTPVGSGTNEDFIAIRTLDVWVHEQDIRRALGLPGHDTGPAAELTIDRLARSLPMILGKRAAAGDGQSAAIVLSGPVERRWTLTVSGGRGTFADVDDPDATLTMRSDDFVALATGRCGPHEATWTSEGDSDLVARIVASLNVMV